MKVQFLNSFERDLNKASPPVRHKVADLISQIEAAGSIRQISQVKKLRGFKNAYRIRIGDFRLGLFVHSDLVQLVHLLDRKSIYRVFPLGRSVG